MIAVIVACEIGFWVLLLAGLLTRYVLRRPTLGALLLVSVPLVDVLLLVVSALDLRTGGEAGIAHGLAAIYLGVSVAFGHQMMRWADERVAHRFAGGPAPAPKPRAGHEHASRERRQWLRHLLAYALAAAILALFTLIAGGLDRALPIWHVMAPWGIVLLIDFAISFSYTLSPRRA
ncbi:hypothetical protein I4J89_20460 [Actinoplanes sp. NEAU-A11]|uniref:2TM domain-containing protein n=1 Tax=Actinoplanes aureus TaxID=2792083 RepID=A0A931G094_9ACTN|nr:hypothetical protein [Actinoplanes aureus]